MMKKAIKVNIRKTGTNELVATKTVEVTDDTMDYFRAIETWNRATDQQGATNIGFDKVQQMAMQDMALQSVEVASGEYATTN